MVRGMNVGLKAILEPEFDKRKTKKAVDDLEDAMDRAENLEIDADFSAVEKRMDALGMGTGGGFGRPGGGGGQGPGLAEQIASAAGLGDVGQAAAGRLGSAVAGAPGGGKLANLGGNFAQKLGGVTGGTAMTVALGGTVALGMLKGIESVASASPAFTKTVSLFGEAMNLFFRPFGKALSDLIRPAFVGLLEMSKSWQEFWGSAQSGENKKGTFLGGGAGALAGGIAGAKGGAMAGAAIGSVIPGAGTAAGGIVGGILGAIVGAITGAGIGAMIGAKLEQVIEDSGIPSMLDDLIPEGLNWGDYVDFLQWGGFVNPLAWAEFVVDIEWDGYVPKLKWETWVTKNKWTRWITKIDWDGWIDDVDWDDWVDDVNWNRWVGVLSWTTYLNPLTWADWLTDLNWRSWIPNLHWSSWIGNLNWGSWISGLSWGTWVPTIHWGSFVPDLNWRDFIDDLGAGVGLARGGIVNRPTRAVIGEGGESEAVIPLSRLNSMLEQAGAAGARAGGGGTANNTRGGNLSSLENKLDTLIRVMKSLDGETRVEIDGRTLITQERKANKRYSSSREVLR